MKRSIIEGEFQKLKIKTMEQNIHDREWLHFNCQGIPFNPIILWKPKFKNDPFRTEIRTIFVGWPWAIKRSDHRHNETRGQKTHRPPAMFWQIYLIRPVNQVSESYELWKTIYTELFTVCLVGLCSLICSTCARVGN